MKLEKIQIRNFRSIKDVEVNFDHNCLVLIGKNEAGKSNVLKAIASVFGLYPLSEKDKRKKIDNEKIDVGGYYIHAIINLSVSDINEVEKRFKNKFDGIENIIFISGIGLYDFIRIAFRDLIINTKIENAGIPYITHWVLPKQDYALKQTLFLLENSILHEGVIKFNLEKEVFEIIKELYLENPIKCHYWQYNDKFLLPNTVDIESFIETPSSFKVVENIFELCHREKIKEEFAAAKLQDGDYSNLLEQVSKKVTSTFQKIWSDFKGTAIQLLPDGDQILIKISDKAKYNCEDRSDGFKKFISILLMLSTPSRANKILENDLILIDEPDQSLYPTSAQFLRDELLNIAKKSKVIFSTHSQYMIDTNNLDRHLVVSKKNDITTLEKEDANAPYTTDELLRRAIGSSIFECIKPKNIIFEGFLDKKLFNLFCQFNNLESKFKNYGQIYLGGISGIDSMVSILLSANKKFIIVADSDEASKKKRIEFNKNFPDVDDVWLAYADVVNSINTMEDFISQEVVENMLKAIDSTFSYDNTKNVIQNIENVTGRDKNKKQEVKNRLVSELEKNTINEEYKEYLKKLEEKLEEL